MVGRDEVTLLVHGTFANAAYDDDGAEPAGGAWWKVSDPTADGSEPTTADLLIAGLEDQEDPNRADSVWRPNPGDGELTYRELVEWSGANTDRARRKAARRLHASLQSLATSRGCTADRPLRVNYVAHSHGGNIVLESLRHLKKRDIVEPRQVALLGTPLTWRYPDLRLIALYIMVISVWVALTSTEEGETLAETLAFAPIWFWMVFGVIELARRIMRVLFRGSPTYGPRPEVLRERFRRGRVVLFINREDEADLMMHLGAAPIDAYRALVRGRPSFRNVGPDGTGKARSNGAHLLRSILILPFRAIEVLVVRPIAYLVVVPVLETLLERFGLGFPFRSVLIRDHEMITWTASDPYKNAIVRRNINPKALRRSALQVASVAPVDPEEYDSRRRADRDRIENLRSAVQETFRGLTEQVHLSHSGYYESEDILDEVALLIAADDDGLDAWVDDLEGVVDLREENGVATTPAAGTLPAGHA